MTLKTIPGSLSNHSERFPGAHKITFFIFFWRFLKQPHHFLRSGRPESNFTIDISKTEVAHWRGSKSEQADLRTEGSNSDRNWIRDGAPLNTLGSHIPIGYVYGCDSTLLYDFDDFVETNVCITLGQISKFFNYYLNDPKTQPWQTDDAKDDSWVDFRPF